MLLSSIITMALISQAIDAHMVLQDPLRFPSVTTGDNGPLNGGSPSNYPCKVHGDPDSFYAFNFPRTKLPAGGNYSMALTGTVVHGGGSCQMSLTKDLKPTRNSVFKVIHSVHGGCTARGVPGNLEPSDPKAPGPDKYVFPIPEDVEPGDYTFAWTWFNDVGNREMYMNCAPVTVTGGNSKSKRQSLSYDGLPDIFLANIPDVTCKSSDGESTSIKFPNPGTSVETNYVMTGNHTLVDPIGTTCHAPLGGVAPDSGTLPSSSSIPVSPSSAVYSAPAMTSSSSSNAATTYTSSLAAMPTSSVAAAPISFPQQPFVSNSSSNAAPATGGSGSCPSTSVPCPTPGDIICVGTSQFGLCDTNNCAIIQALATGTTCSNNVITKRSKNFIPSMSYKRHGMHPHGVAHRRSPLH